jgi:hypothetical protein
LDVDECRWPEWLKMNSMDEIRIGDQIVRYDPERTRQAYSTIEFGDPEQCGCSYCRNFIAQRSIAYPTSFRILLDQLGIDFEKEGEVYESGAEGNLRLYGGWLFFSGELIGPGERLVTEVESGFQYWFADSKRLPKPGGDFGASVAAVEFYTKIPWVVEGEP